MSRAGAPSDPLSPFVLHRRKIHLGSSPLAPSAAALHGGTNIYSNHSGNPLHVLFGLTLSNASLFIATYAIYSRMLFSWYCAVLPLLAALSLRSGPQICKRMLAAPGIEEPLAALFQFVSTAQ